MLWQHQVVEAHVAKLQPVMVKPIGGGTIASVHLGMSGLSARVDVHVQLTCGSSMALTETGGVTSSVPIWT
jgi:hypothetical protein